MFSGNSEEIQKRAGSKARTYRLNYSNLLLLKSFIPEIREEMNIGETHTTTIHYNILQILKRKKEELDTRRVLPSGK